MSVGYNEFKIGNIYDDDIEKMWYSKNRKNLLNALKPSKICVDCPNGSCTNGCIVASYIHNGSLASADPCCPLIELYSKDTGWKEVVI